MQYRKLTFFIAVFSFLVSYCNTADARVDVFPAPSLMPQGQGSGTPLPDQFTGSISHQIPIVVPPGRSGMEPGLALVYRSGNGEGWIGQGWSLDVGSIERNLKGGVNYSGDDFVFKMGGGSDLVAVGSGVYKAKIEGAYNRIKKIGTGAGTYWEVTDKKGTVYRFGYDTSSRQDRSSGSSDIFKWCLDKITDTNGNYMTISYIKDQGQIYLSRIDYTGHTPTSLAANKYVSFIREARTDAPFMNTLNFDVKTAWRLKAIEIHAKTGATDNVVRKYDLEYDTDPIANGSQYSPATDRSLLTKVMEKGADGSAKPPTEFTYTSEQAANGLHESSFTDGMLWQDATYTYVGDFNGDGIHDIAKRDGVSNFTFRVKEGARAVTPDFVGYIYGTSNVNWNGTPFTFIGDFNGDGTSDIVARDNTNLWLYTAEDHLFTETPSTTSNWGPIEWTWSGDFDGDGKADIASRSGNDIYIKRFNGTVLSESTWTTSGGWGASATTYTGDFNGDGKTDIASRSGGSVYMRLSTGTGFAPVVTWSTTSTMWGANDMTWTGDFNGDGKTDFATASGNTVWIKRSTGSSFIEVPITLSVGQWGESDKRWARDFNGDGKTDIMVADSAGNFDLYYSTGYSLSRLSVIMSPANWGDSGKWIGDFNGDGKTDLATAGSSTFWVKQANYFPVDLLTNIKNGIGGETTITYVPSTQYPNTLLPFPVY